MRTPAYLGDWLREGKFGQGLEGYKGLHGQGNLSDVGG